MAHFRCPTFNSLNNYMPNMTRLTLASHNEFCRSPTISPLRYPEEETELFSQTRLDDTDDFQSNAQVSLSRSRSRSRSRSHFAGLGISYPQESEGYTKADAHNLKATFTDTIPPSDSQLSSRRKAIKIELGDPTMGLQGELSCFYEPPIMPFRSSSSPLSSYTSDTFSSTNVLYQGATTLYSDIDTNMTPKTFGSIATASAMTVDGLTDPFAATANFALQYIAASGSSNTLPSHSSGSELSLLEELYSDDREISWTPASPIPKSDPSLEIKTAAQWMDPSFGIDLLEISPGRLSGVARPSRAFTLPSPFSCLEIPFQSLEGIFEMHPKDRRNLEAADATSPRVVTGNLEGAARYEVFLPPVKQDDDDRSDYKPSDSDYEHNGLSSSSFPSPCRKTRNRKRVPKIPKHPRHHCKTIKTEKPGSPKLKQKKQKQKIKIITQTMVQPMPALQETGYIDLGTPIVNAHLGIDLDALLSKAERYRVRNPGRVYDNNWLASFAGRVSDRGEYASEYRCYVEGCAQVNKRRDHILIHVGSHLDQRSYACAYCTSRFLRKNECKRHEASHSGVKPFICDFCPDTAFVRQDLLRRHTARAHGITIVRKRKSDISKEEDEESEAARPMKRVKKECDI